MPKLNWRKWRAGLFVAGATGFCLALIPLASTPEMTCRSFLLCVLAFMGREIAGFFKRYPVESVKEDVSPFTKEMP